MSLPRELRDQIYEQTLYSPPTDEEQKLAVEHPNEWCLIRKHFPGLWRPFRHYHHATRRDDIDSQPFVWNHKLWGDSPGIFNTCRSFRQEAKALYFKSHILFELSYTPGKEFMRWKRSTDPYYLDMIRTVHIVALGDARLTAKEWQKVPKHIHERVLQKRGSPIHYCVLDCSDEPLFRITICNDCTTIVLRSRAKLEKGQGAEIVERFESWSKDLPAKYRFSGMDILAAVERLLNLTDEDSRHTDRIFKVKVKADELLDILVDEFDDFPEPEVRLRDDYPYVVAQVKPSQPVS